MDLLLEEIGPFGRFQKLTIALLGLVFSLTSATLYLTIFTTAEPKLDCNQTCESWSNVTKFGERSLPNECKFDDSYYGTTIVTDWYLICEKTRLVSLTQTIYMTGSLCSLFFGFIGDYFGRRKSIVGFLMLLSSVLLVSHFLQLSFIKISPLVKYTIYCISLFITGFISNILYGNAFVLLMEITTSKYHTISSIAALYTYIFGELFVVLVAYFIRDWHIYNWISVAYSIIVMAISLVFIPESPRWLLTKRQNSKADWILSNIAKKNKRIYRRKYFKAELNSLLERNQIDELYDDDSADTTSEKKCITAKSLSKTILLMITFIALSLTYYGISFGINTIEGLNPYAAHILSCIFEMIGYTLSILNEKIGRKKVNVIFLLLSAISCFLVGYVPSFIKTKNHGIFSLYSLVMLSLVAVSKCMASTAFNNIWVYASELYPTTTRNSTLLLLNGVARIGGISAPFINKLRINLWKDIQLPYLIFSTASLLAGIFGLLLPETLNK